MKNTIRRLLCIILSAILITNTFPLLAFANTSRNTTISETTSLSGTKSDSLTAEPISASPTGVMELEFLREENTKHFIMEDGTYQAVSYGGAVHWLDSDGNWQDIDNTLILAADQSTPAYTDTQGRTRFAETLTQNQPVITLNEDSYTIAMWLAPVPTGTVTMSIDAIQPINESTAVVNNPSHPRLSSTQTPSQAAISKLRSSVIYKNVLSGLDIEYVLDGKTIKENIIVKTRSDSYCYRFALETDGLYAQQQSDGSIKLCDIITDEEKYIIPTPFMYDAAETVSENVEYQLSQSGEKYYLTVIADAQWINAEDRIFPITIDPTIGPVTATQDTYVCEPFPNTSYGSSSHMWIANNTSYWKNAVAYISFVLPTIPEDAEINGATLSTHYYYPDYAHSEYMFVTTHRVLMPWNESTLNWSSATQYQNLGINTTATDGQYIYSGYGAVASSPDELIFDITSSVSQWYGGASNYGIALKHSMGTSLSVMFCSSEAETSLAPKMTVSYSFPKLEDGIYWIKNVGNGRYMDTANGGKTENTKLQQYALSTEEKPIHQLYKVQCIGNSSTYTIRPLTNCATKLYADSSDNIVLKKDGTTQYETWVIFYSAQNRLICNTGITQNGYLSTPTVSTNGAPLILSDRASANSSWKFIPYDGPPINEMTWISTTDELEIRNTFNFEASISSTDLAVNGPISYRLEGIECEADDVATMSDSGFLTPQGPGFVNVIAEIPGTSHFLQQAVQLTSAASLTLQLFYDPDYSTRYPDAYNRITEEFYLLKAFYLENFNIYIKLESIEERESFASNCITKDGIEGTCQCSDWACSNAILTGYEVPVEPQPFHTNLTCILAALARDANAQYGDGTCVIQYIGTRSCGVHDGIHKDQPYWGYANPYTNTAVINDPRLDKNAEAETLIHEFGHLIGVEDHYANESGMPSTSTMNTNYQGYNFSQNCMYGENRFMLEDETFCEGCKKKVSDWLDRSSHD